MKVPGIIHVPPPKLEDVIDEREYAVSWYFCQLKIDEEEKDTNCKDANGFPNCRTCDYQIKINEQIQKDMEEIEAWNKTSSQFTHENRREP